MPSLFLRRARAQTGVLLGVAVIQLVACTVITALVLIAGGAIDAGLRAAFAQAPVSQRAAEVTVAASAAPEDVQQPVVATLEQALSIGGITPPVHFSLESTPLPVRGYDGARVVVIGYDDLPAHTDLVDGSWPDPSVTGDDSTPVAVHAAAAAALGLGLGDTLVVGRADEPVPLMMVGTWLPTDPTDVFWFGAPLEIDGVGPGGVRGPVAGPASALAERFPDLDPRWRSAAPTEGIDTATIAGLALRAGDLQDRLRFDSGLADEVAPRVSTELPEFVPRLRLEAIAARSSMLVPLLIVAVLVGATVLLAGRLVRQRRDVEMALVRARGATRAQLWGAGLLEALPVALPAAALGAPLGALVARTVSDAAFVRPADSPAVVLTTGTGLAAWAVSGAVAVACSAVLVAVVASAPATDATRAYRSARGGLLRSGGDVALAITAAVAVWQAQRYGSPLVAGAAGADSTASTIGVDGPLGVDPVIVLAPVLVLVAGAALTVRLLPAAVRLAERVVSRGKGLSSSLAAWQVGRRPEVLGVTSILVVLSIAAANVSVTLTDTWNRLQADRASQEVGADVRVVPADGSTRRGSATEQPLVSYRDLPGVEQVAAAVRADARTESTGATLLAVDTRTAADVLFLRPDLVGGRSPAETLTPLREDRLEPPSLALPPGDRIMVDVTMIGEPPADSPDPPGKVAAEAQLRGQAQLLLGTPAGFVRTVNLGDVTAGETINLSAPLPPLPGGPAEESWSLVGFDVTWDISDESLVEEVTVRIEDARVERSGGEASAAELSEPDAEWFSVLLGATQGTLPPVLAVTSDGGVLEVQAESSGAGVRLLPGAPYSAAFPAVVTTEFAEVTGARVGDRIFVDVGPSRSTVEVTTVVETVPTVAAGTPAILADLQSLVAAELRAGVEPRANGEWFLDVGADVTREETSAVASAVVAASGAEVDVLDRERLIAELRGDPLGAGPLGALALAVAAAVVLTVCGSLLGRTVTARRRRGEAAILLTMGASRRHIAHGRIAEQVLVASGCAVVGSAVGLVATGLLVPVLVRPSMDRPASAGLDVLVTVSWPTTALIGLLGVALVVSVALLPRGGGHGLPLAAAMREVSAP